MFYYCNCFHCSLKTVFHIVFFFFHIVFFILIFLSFRQRIFFFQQFFLFTEKVKLGTLGHFLKFLLPSNMISHLMVIQLSCHNPFPSNTVDILPLFSVIKWLEEKSSLTLFKKIFYQHSLCFCLATCKFFFSI